MQFTVPDMTCGGCAAAVERAVARLDPRAKVVVDLASKRVEIESALPAERVSAAIADAGFTPESAPA
jgi:copper chaperone